MKIFSTSVCVALVATTASSFVAPASTHPRRLSTTLSGSSRADENAKPIPDIWQNLRTVEKDIIVQETLKGTDESTLSKMLINEMLETAVEFVHTAEQVEEEHQHAAHQDLEKALDQENVLKEYIKEARHDEDDAEFILDVYERKHLGEDGKKRRELAVSEIASHVDTYVEQRLRQAQALEMEAKTKEEEAKYNLEELQHQEEEFKAVLEQLKSLDKEEVVEEEDVENHF